MLATPLVDGLKRVSLALETAKLISPIAILVYVDSDRRFIRSYGGSIVAAIVSLLLGFVVWLSLADWPYRVQLAIVVVLAIFCSAMFLLRSSVAMAWRRSRVDARAQRLPPSLVGNYDAVAFYCPWYGMVSIALAPSLDELLSDTVKRQLLAGIAVPSSDAVELLISSIETVAINTTTANGFISNGLNSQLIMANQLSQE